MAIDSIGSLGSAQFQPRPPQNSGTQNSGTDNLTVQQFLQNPQQGSQAQGSSAPVQTQTTNAVQQPGNTQQSQPANPQAANDTPDTRQTLSDFLNQQTRQAAEPSSQQPGTTQPQTASNSALNYGADGAANQTQNPNQAGQLVSLSV